MAGYDATTELVGDDFEVTLPSGVARLRPYGLLTMDQAERALTEPTAVLVDAGADEDSRLILADDLPGLPVRHVALLSEAWRAASKLRPGDSTGSA